MKNKLRKDIERRIQFAAGELEFLCSRQAILLFQGRKIAVERYRWKVEMLSPSWRAFHHYCLFSDRRRGNISRCNLGRQAFRLFYNQGVLTGFRQAAW